jgi:hypothetical protein
VDTPFEQGIKAWHDFYILAGGAAATLTGLLFVSVSLHLDMFTDATESEVRSLAEATLINFVYILVMSLIIVAPNHTPLGLGLFLLALAVGGLLRVLSAFVRRIRVLHLELRHTQAMDMWLFFWTVAVPTAYHLTLFYVSIAILGADTGQLGWLVWVIIALLITATVTAWNMLVRLSFFRQRLAAHKKSSEAQAQPQPIAPSNS